jgi:hypothetical protein
VRQVHCPFCALSKQNVCGTFIWKVPGHAPESFYICSGRWSACCCAITIRWRAPALTHSIESFHGNVLAEVNQSLVFIVRPQTDNLCACMTTQHKLCTQIHTHPQKVNKGDGHFNEIFVTLKGIPVCLMKTIPLCYINIYCTRNSHKTQPVT